MISALKTDEVNVMDDNDEDMDELIIGNDIGNDENEGKHTTRVMDYNNDQNDEELNDKREVNRDEDSDEIDTDPNYDFKFHTKKNKLVFDIDMSMGGSKLVIDNMIKEVLNKSTIRNIQDVKKTVYDEMEVASGKSKIKVPTIIMNGFNLESIVK